MAKPEKKAKSKKRANSNEEIDQNKKNKAIPSPPKMQSLTMQDLIKEAGEAPDVYIDDVFSNSVLLNDIHEFRTNHEKSGYVLSVVPYSVYQKVHFLRLFTNDKTVPAKTVFGKHSLTIGSVITLPEMARTVKSAEEVLGQAEGLFIIFESLLSSIYS